MNMPNSLVLSCNNPVFVGVLQDWILDHCNFEVIFWECGWDDANIGLTYNRLSGTGYGIGYGNYNNGIVGADGNGDGEGNGYGTGRGSGHRYHRNGPDNYVSRMYYDVGFIDEIVNEGDGHGCGCYDNNLYIPYGYVDGNGRGNGFNANV